MTGVYTVKKLVVQGAWDEGFDFYGPFDDDDAAAKFITSLWNEATDDEWPITMFADLLVPKETP